ncbi:hypothetical protein WDJ51_09100 [Rathayibacter sp. YIM 133350]|uniref:hypothetical protein n=1 Tax=Rathayibacter sp. YIM 133350 TaxID=3131992 RepID=UPI00307DD53C
MMALTFASQLLSAGSTLILPTLGLATADLYAAATQMGLASLTGIVVGIVYNLAIGRPNFRGWRLWAGLAALFSIGIATVLFFLLRGQGLFDRLPINEGAVVIASFGLGGALLSAGGVIAVREACLGRPNLLAGVTVAPNAALFIAVGATALFSSGVRTVWEVTIPGLAWALAALVMLIVSFRRMRMHDGAPENLSESRHPSTLQTVALALGVITSSILPSFYMAAVVGLAVGLPYFLYLSTKLGNSFVSLGVNSILMVKYNWVQEHRLHLRWPVLLAIFGTALIALAVIAHVWKGSTLQPLSYVLVALAWLLLITAGALIIREMNAQRLSRALLTKVVVDLLVSITIAVTLTLHPSVTGYFGAFMGSQGATLAVSGYSLGSRSLGVLGALVVAASVLLGLSGW